MNRHCRWSEELSAYLDGELDGKSRVKFETHLGGCFACKEMLQDLRCLRDSFQSLPQQEMGFDLGPVVLADPRRRAHQAWRPSFNWWQLLPVSFAAAATVSLGIFMGISLTNRPPDTELAGTTLAMFDPIPPGGVCIGFAGCYPKEKI